jgi:hypothetical protein
MGARNKHLRAITRDVYSALPKSCAIRCCACGRPMAHTGGIRVTCSEECKQRWKRDRREADRAEARSAPADNAVHDVIEEVPRAPDCTPDPHTH